MNIRKLETQTRKTRLFLACFWFSFRKIPAPIKMELALSPPAPPKKQPPPPPLRGGISWAWRFSCRKGKKPQAPIKLAQLPFLALELRAQKITDMRLLLILVEERIAKPRKEIIRGSKAIAALQQFHTVCGSFLESKTRGNAIRGHRKLLLTTCHIKATIVNTPPRLPWFCKPWWSRCCWRFLAKCARESREFRDCEEPPNSGKQRRIRPFREFRTFRDSSSENTPFRDDTFVRSR